MTHRTKIEMKFGTHTIFKSPRELTLQQLDHLKQALAMTCKCQVDDIEVIYTKSNPNLSNYEISKLGKLFRYDGYLAIDKVSLPFELGSNEHLDAILDGTLENKLKFITF
jgi:hypothetical protein